jgi:hypothetical protein
MFTATRDIETRRAHMDPIVSYFILEQCHQKAAVVNLFLESLCIWASLGVDKQCQMTVFTQ